MTIKLPDAVKRIVRRRGHPVIAWFDIERIVRELYRAGEFEGQSLRLRSSAPPAYVVSGLRSLLTDDRFADRGDDDRANARERFLMELAAVEGQKLLVPDPDFPSTLWRVAGIPDGTTEEICCLADPWIYVSHLSAMQQWGLTNRQPEALHLTRPDAVLWRNRAKQEIREEYPELEPGHKAPNPRKRISFPKQVRRRPLWMHEPAYFGRMISVPDTFARIATVGQTFRDMLHEPFLCGGIRHVLEVWEQHASTYLDEIIEAMNAPELHTTKIAFVRAGYILTERLGLEDPRITAWQIHASRGSSRKLDPEQPFAGTYSERWMLSLNV